MNISATVNELEGLKRSIKVNVNKEEYISQYKKDLNRYKSTIKIDGFRAGKVPESVILKNYKERIHGDVLNTFGERMMGFNQWALMNEYDRGTTHPLDQAHKDAVKLMKPKFKKLIDPLGALGVG